MRLYLDTSVIGAVADEWPLNRKEVTKILLESIISNKHTGIISNVVTEEIEQSPGHLKKLLLEELNRIPLQLVEESVESIEVADAYSAEGFIRKGSVADLRHLAIAATSGVDAVVSWNFRDMVNIRTRRAIHSINIKRGLPFIEIVSPEEVIEYEG